MGSLINNRQQHLFPKDGINKYWGLRDELKSIMQIKTRFLKTENDI